jgi:hypothetical protein
MLTMFLARPRAASMVCVAVVDQQTEDGTLRYRIPVWRGSGFDVMAEVYALSADGGEFRLSKDRVPFPAGQLRKLWSMLREKRAQWGESVTLNPAPVEKPGPVPASEVKATGPWDPAPSPTLDAAACDPQQSNINEQRSEGPCSIPF